MNKHQKGCMGETKINEGLAEVYGAMLGDGCLSQYFSKCEKREKHCSLLTGHTHDEPYYRKIIQPIFIREFGIGGCIRFREKVNAVRFETCNKKVFIFFKELGFPVGEKGNRLRIPEVILFDDKLAIACVRGIFDTDGSVYKRYSKQYKKHTRFYNYNVIQFKLICYKIIEQIKYILNKVNIKTTKISEYKNSFTLRITDQKEIYKFMNLVKPNNNWHIERYLKI